ncbi:MAG: hypothetical protein K2M03_04585 [Muribaculaceae bacterium]|nr:hypothetical protein [Muribaculaceae bacterium]
MIKQSEIIEIGKFFKAHGLKGEMNVIVDYDPEILEEGYPLIVDVDGIFVPFYAESVRPKGSQSSLLKLDGVDTKEGTAEFVNKNIYMLKRDVAEFLDIDAEQLEHDNDIIGYTVIDTELGELGQITDMDYSTENILMTINKNTENGTEGSIETDEGLSDEVVIPFRDNFIYKLDEDNKTVRVELPQSIRELLV